MTIIFFSNQFYYPEQTLAKPVLFVCPASVVTSRYLDRISEHYLISNKPYDYENEFTWVYICTEIRKYELEITQTAGYNKTCRV